MSPATELEDLSHRMRTLIEAQDWDNVLPMISPSMRARVGGEELDLEGWLAMGRGFFAAFPDLRHDAQEQIVAGDQIAIRYVVRGTHKGEFMGIPATERPIELNMIVIDRWQEGRLVEHSGQFDSVGLMQQIGAIPAG